MEIYSMKIDFQRMSKEELKAYVLTHKEDTEAFYALADRLKTDNQDVPWYPSPTTPEAMAIMEQAMTEKLKTKNED
jgi:hypothetical protein